MLYLTTASAQCNGRKHSRNHQKTLQPLHPSTLQVFGSRHRVGTGVAPPDQDWRRSRGPFPIALMRECHAWLNQHPSTWRNTVHFPQGTAGLATQQAASCLTALNMQQPTYWTINGRSRSGQAAFPVGTTVRKPLKKTASELIFERWRGWRSLVQANLDHLCAFNRDRSDSD